MEAVQNCDVICTDTFVSMGRTDREKRLKEFQGYQVAIEQQFPRNYLNCKG